MPNPTGDESGAIANGDAAGTAHHLNEILRDGGIDRHSAMHSVIRGAVDVQGGDATVSELAGISVQDLPDAISPEAMIPLVAIRDLMLSAGWQLEFKAIETKPAS